MKSWVVFQLAAESCSRDINSARRFDHCRMLIVVLDFQLSRIVFLATVRAMRVGLINVRFELVMMDMSPSRQRIGDNGMV